MTGRAVAGLAPHRLLAAAARHRALLAGGLAAAAVAAGLSAVGPPAAEPAVTLLGAAHDLPAGATLGEHDLVPVAVPAALVPAGALSDPSAAVGRALAGPVRQGEALTDVRLVGAALVPPGRLVAAPLRVVDPAVAALVRAGDRIDVLGASPAGGVAARLVAGDLTVLAVPALEEAGEGALLVVAASPATAARLAASAVTDRLSVTVHGR